MWGILVRNNEDYFDNWAVSKDLTILFKVHVMRLLLLLRTAEGLCAKASPRTTGRK